MNATPDATAHDKVVKAVEGKHWDDQDWPQCGQMVHGVQCGEQAGRVILEDDERMVTYISPMMSSDVDGIHENEIPLCGQHYEEWHRERDRFNDLVNA